MRITSWGPAALVLIALPAGLAAQGLGDASKKEQARRKQTDAAAKPKTYTDADVKGLPPIANEGDASKPAAGGTASAPAAASAGGSGEERVRQQDEQIWRSRLAKANARLEAARQAHETLASMTLVPGYVYQDAQGRTVIHSVEQLQQMTARAKAERDSAQKALDDLLEEARRANVPPGWLR